MRYSEDELALLKRVFSGDSGEHLLKLLRKSFLPELDPNAPIGQNFDLWMTVDIKNVSPEEAYRQIIARNTVIAHVEQRLVELSLLANRDVPSPVTVAEALKKDDTQ